MNTTQLKLVERFLRGVGLVDISLASAVRRLPACAYGFRLVKETSDVGEALDFLSTLTWPATRHVLFSAGDQQSVFVNNSRNGSDYADYTFHIPRDLKCRFARVINDKKRWVVTKGGEKVLTEYEARIFSLQNVQGETVRDIICMDDGGRWTFRAMGDPHPIEAQFPYDAVKKSARFSEENLKQLAQAYGFLLPDARLFVNAGKYALFAQPYDYEVQACTLEQADDPAYGYFVRGMGWVKHMATHASSVVADFERCIQINPEYEPQVRGHLEAAKKQLGKG